MRRGAWIALGVAGLAVGACTYPDFEFRSEGQGGAGGAGGGGAGGGGAGGSGGDGGSGGISLPIVPCKDGTACDPGQVCCYDLTGPPFDDLCAEPGGCDASHTTFPCNSSADCSTGKICCGLKPMTFYGSIACQESCGVDESMVCDSSTGEGCIAPDTCMPSAYLGYGYCAVM